MGSTAVAFTYDGLGNRIGKTVGSTAYTYYYNSNQLAAWQKGSETYYCLYDNTGICGFYRNGQLYLFAKNMLGDVVALYYVGSSTATVMAKYEYDAWGVCTVKNPDGTVNTSADFIGNINPFRYRGYYYDTELDLYWLKTRHYDPKVGRFLTADSIQYYDSSVIGGTNLYAYCLNNPINNVDPTGTFSLRFTTQIQLWPKNLSYRVKDIIEGVTGEIINIKRKALDLVAKESETKKIINDVYFETFIGKIYETSRKEVRSESPFFAIVDKSNIGKSYGFGINFSPSSSLTLQIGTNNGLQVRIYTKSNIIGFGLKGTHQVTVTGGVRRGGRSKEWTFEPSSILPVCVVVFKTVPYVIPFFAPLFA